MTPRDNAFLKYYFFPVNHDFSEYYGLTHFHQPSAIYLLRTLDRTFFFSKIRLFFDFFEISLINQVGLFLHTTNHEYMNTPVYINLMRLFAQIVRFIGSSMVLKKTQYIVQR